MCVRDLLARGAHAAHTGCDRAVRPAPAQHQRLRGVGIVDLQLGDVLRDPGDLLRAQTHHQVVVLRVVADVARDVLLLESSDAVLEAGGAGNCPRAGERLLVAPIGLEVVPVRLGEFRLDRRDGLDVREQPGL